MMNICRTLQKIPRVITQSNNRQLCIQRCHHSNLSNYTKTPSTNGGYKTGLLLLTSGLIGGSAIYFKDEIFGDNDFSGSEIRFLKSVGFQKEYFYHGFLGSGLYNWRSESLLEKYNNLFREHINKLNENQTKELCEECVKFDPSSIASIRPEFVTYDLLILMSETTYLHYGDQKFFDFAGYDRQFIAKMTYNEFMEYYEMHCQNFSVDKSHDIVIREYAREIFPVITPVIHFETYMAKHRSLKDIGADLP